jgi:hypothetical protein
VAGRRDGRLDVSGTGFTDGSDCDDGVGDWRKFDTGLGLGAGLDVALGSGTLMIGARHTLGLQSVYRLEAFVVIPASSRLVDHLRVSVLPLDAQRDGRVAAATPTLLQRAQ